jgi:hypothetical protein
MIERLRSNQARPREIESKQIGLKWLREMLALDVRQLYAQMCCPMMLLAGARLRLTIAPLNSPNYQKNYNTDGRLGYEKIDDARIAHIKVFHDAKRPSVLELPLAAVGAAGT